MIRIAVSGKLGCGKDLFLTKAQEFFPKLDFQNEKMAKSIYNLTSLIQDSLYIPRIKDGRLLQFIGNHYRDLYPDIWVDSFFTNTHDVNSNVIVTDVRYPNELEACKQKGFTTIRILRQDEFRLNNLGNRDLKHLSETALDDTPITEYDYVINNNGTLEMFEGAVINVVNDILRDEK